MTYYGGKTIIIFFLFLAVPHGMWDLTSLTRDWTYAPCIGSTEFSPLDRQGSPYCNYYRTENIECESPIK